ncbi:putative glucosyltransferase [Candidatus Terasakiella magnetica]|uniref:Putative glucosyltransferase n=1 Tax=Candidatus Terasakiella magnetica TaxID=1867952 RepID=A0A1C3RL22_9PROT|nr:sugar phosphorylase [Candidatus Terasakiella magnetica]SCA57951.1 putative glucosyltransferase [Candidatus Terasakiella magnetica]
MSWFTNDQLDHVSHHLELIYPNANHKDLAGDVLAAFGVAATSNQQETTHLWDQNDVVMITYGDSLCEEGEKPLHSLKHFLNEYLSGIINGVHILPFFPYTSDDGFAVQDYDQVRSDLGEWSDITDIAQKFRLMADVVINHASSKHEWFRQFEEGKAPGCDYIKTAFPEDNLSDVVRPRPFELLRPTQTKNGLKHVWCTFSHDQVDLDFGNPALLIEFIKIMRRYIDHGVRIFRLDAVAFLWKEVNSTSLHLPQTHEIIKLIRTLVDMRDETVIIITETNVPNHENLQYFGNANEAHVVYNFSLPPLLLHALLTGRSEFLRHWAASTPPLQNGCSYLNFTASHDGIGLRPVEGLLSKNDIDILLNTIELFGGTVTTRSIGEGVEKPYEMNITYFDALKGTIKGPDHLQKERFLASQTIMMSLQGIPAFYILSLLATPNDYVKMEETQHNRSINRHQWDYQKLIQLLDGATSIQAQIFNEIRRLLAIRIEQPAFHPDATQYMIQPSSGFFGFLREHKGEKQLIYVVTNLQAEESCLSLLDLNLSTSQKWIDLISGAVINLSEGTLNFAPYQTVWITQQTD